MLHNDRIFKATRNNKKEGTWKNASRPNLPKTLSLFGYQYRCNLSEGFPLLTTKKVSLKNISTELIWFLRGGNPLNVKYLHDNNCHIWDDDCYRYYKSTEQFKVDQFSQNQFNEWIGVGCGDYTYGDCPLGYELWRNFNGVDQIAELIKGLKERPEDRGHQLTALNPAYRDVALRPCHVYAQFNCRKIEYNEGFLESNSYLSKNSPLYFLDCQLYQRSSDVFLGVPYNTASYSLLTHIIAEICGFVVGDFIHTFGDVHIYENHMKAVDEQLSRTPDKLPKLKINPSMLNRDDINVLDLNELILGMTNKDFTLENYNPQPSIEAKLSVGL